MSGAAVGKLSVLTAVSPGRTTMLQKTLDSLAKGDDSPLAAVGGVHFARLQVIPYLESPDGDPVSQTSYLLYGSWFDGEVADHIDALCDHMGQEADAIWRHCDGYPGAASATEFRRYMLDHSIEPGYPFDGYAAKVDEIGECLALRSELGKFAVEARDLDDRALRRRWGERFPRGFE